MGGEELKPSRCKAVFVSYQKGVVQVHVDVGRPWRDSVVGRTIEKITKAKQHVVVIQGQSRTFIKGDGLPLPDVIQDALEPK
jgi:hypothetical protein